MMTTPAISIIIPIYNKAAYLTRTFDSICKQTFSDFEVLLVDDGSTDDSFNVCKAYSERDSRFRVFHHENMGAAKSRNRGLDEAAGRYVVFLDADDRFHCDMLEVAYEAITATGAQVAVWGYNEISAETGEIRSIGLGDEVYRHADITMDHMYKLRTVPWNKLIDRTFLVDSGIRFQSIPTENDVFFSNALVLTASKIVTVSSPLIDYFCGLEGSLTQNRVNKKSNFLLAYDKIYEYLENREPKLAVAFIDLILTWMWNMVTSGDFVNVRSMAIDMPTCSNLQRAFRKLVDEESIKYINRVFMKLIMQESIDCIGVNLYRYTVPAFLTIKGKIAVCGAGFRCHKLLQVLEEQGIRIECVADNNPKLIGGMIFGYPICSFDDAAAKADTYVVLNEDYYDALKVQIGDARIINYSALEYILLKNGTIELQKYSKNRFGTWVILGGSNLTHYYQLLLMRMGVFPDYVIDNYLEEGSFQNGMRVISDKELLSNNYKIVACENSEFIERIKSLGVETDARVYDYKKLLWLWTSSFDAINLLSKKESSEEPITTVLIDAFGGVGWGGTEIWSYKVGQGLNDNGYKVKILGSTCQTQQDRWEGLIKRIPYDREDPLRMFDSVILIARYMIKMLPIVLINNWTEETFCAAFLVKQLFPDKVHILSIIHNDVESLYENVKKWHAQMDLISCVSQRIKNRIINEIGISNDKVISKENFVENINSNFNNVRSYDEPLRIGWAARLEVEQKRADLIPRLIEELDKLGINYTFQIAGDGTCYEMLDSWIRDTKHDDRVILRGFIPQNGMSDFWRKQHIYVNISEYEGASLAMLEAMNYGVVPVVTDVSGVNEFISDGVNGFIRNIGDLDSIATSIAYLGEHEEERHRFSEECRRIIVEKCNYQNYIGYVEKIVDTVSALKR